MSTEGEGGRGGGGVRGDIAWIKGHVCTGYCIGCNFWRTQFL